MSECECLVPMDVYDGPDVCNVRIRKARKEHHCCECRRVIRRGERYENVRGRWDGSWDEFRTCLGCVNIRGQVFCEGYIYGEMFMNMADADVISPNRPPSACLMRELSPAGAQVLKEWWMGLVKQQMELVGQETR